MQKQLEGNKLAQWGLLLVVIGAAVQLTLLLGRVLSPLSGWAIVIGVILLIVGVVLPRRRRRY